MIEPRGKVRKEVKNKYGDRSTIRAFLDICISIITKFKAKSA